MTDEIRIHANELHKEITDVQNKVSLIQDMEDQLRICLYNSNIGSVEIPPGVRDEVLDLVRVYFMKQQEDLQNEFEKL